MFIDSCVWIAAKKENDSWHKKAKKIVKEIIEQKKSVKITGYILNETLNFLERKSSHENAVLAGKGLLFSENVKIVDIDEIFVREGFKVFEKYQGLSFTDATLACVMREFNDAELVSFDSGFDKVEWINRYEALPPVKGKV